MHRRLVQNAFSKAESRKFTAIQENEARKLVRRILLNSKDWKRLMRLFSTAVIMQIMTGQEVKGPDDEYVRIAEDINNAISGGPPLGASGLDAFPWLKHLPGWCDPTRSTRYVRKWAHAIHDVQVVPYERVMKEIRAGSAKPSLVAVMVLEEEARAQRGESPLLTPERVQGIIGAVYGGRWAMPLTTLSKTADTPVVFTFAITMQPEVQKKAKAELSAVLEPDRLPNLSDREHLPYIERVVQETFRLRVTFVAGVPRRAMEDDMYKDMLIPKGSLILTNSTAITHDERVYSEPWKFDPDRYLPKDQGGRGEPMTAPHFGYGRRICPGRFTGENSVFIAIATMLHVLSFDKERDEEGNEITVNAETTDYGGGLGR
ncbi:cytochrome P450 [Schizophyllum commune]